MNLKASKEGGTGEGLEGGEKCSNYIIISLSLHMYKYTRTHMHTYISS